MCMYIHTSLRKYGTTCALQQQRAGADSQTRRVGEVLHLFGWLLLLGPGNRIDRSHRSHKLPYPAQPHILFRADGTDGGGAKMHLQGRAQFFGRLDEALFGWEPWRGMRPQSVVHRCGEFARVLLLSPPFCSSSLVRFQAYRVELNARSVDQFVITYHRHIHIFVLASFTIWRA